MGKFKEQTIEQEESCETNLELFDDNTIQLCDYRPAKLYSAKEVILSTIPRIELINEVMTS